jgi:hypothetical protein
MMQKIEHILKFAAQKAKQFEAQAFGDSRVEDAAQVLEDIALMLGDVRLPDPPSSASGEK